MSMTYYDFIDQLHDDAGRLGCRRIRRSSFDTILSVSAVRDELRIHGQELRDMGVVSIRLFGSVARNEATSDSDVDMAIEYRRTEKGKGWFMLRDHIRSLLGKRVDTIDYPLADEAPPDFRSNFEREAVLVDF